MQEPELKFQIYRDAAEPREWRWRLWTKNSKKIANSGEGYHNYDDCRAMVDKIIEHAKDAKVEVDKS